MWDIRSSSSQPTRSINVGIESQVCRPNFSKEVYCIDMDDDFLVCGGGIELGLWHISSSSLASTLKTESSINQLYYALEMVDGGSILAGGSGSILNRFNYSGDLIISMDSFQRLHAIHVLHTMEWNSSKITLVAGEGSEVYFLANFGFVSSALNIVDCY